jgi:4-hydroxybenzoate polyprenyltransferase
MGVNLDKVDCAFSSCLKQVGTWAEMIKVEHTVFALPFALSGLILAQHRLPSPNIFFWTILAFLGARSAAMTLNRIIDAEIDARNPRTSTRAIPEGKISSGQALLLAIAAFFLMIFAASKLPPLCLWLSPIAIIWLSLYSYTKRFTWLCHLVLGIALGGAALGGWIAASGPLNTWAPWILALAVSTWVAGFDIIYACQDIEVDRMERLFSLPSTLSISAALNISRCLHLLTILALIFLGLSLHLGWIYFMGVAIVTVMLIWEQSLVKPNDLSKINAAFFTINGWVSILSFLFILIDVSLS